MASEEQKQEAMLDLSNVMNNGGTYNNIQDIATTHFDKEIHHDSPFWHELEEYIINAIEALDE